jgi:hypothetical protein
MMYEHRQSDDGIVPAKSPNKPRRLGAEEMEGRPSAKGNAQQGCMSRTQGRTRHVKSSGVHTSARRRHHPRQEPDAVIPLVRICEGGGSQEPSLPRPAQPPAPRAPCTQGTLYPAPLPALARRLAAAGRAAPADAKIYFEKRATTRVAPTFW